MKTSEEFFFDRHFYFLTPELEKPEIFGGVSLNYTCSSAIVNFKHNPKIWNQNIPGSLLLFFNIFFSNYLQQKREFYKKYKYYANQNFFSPIFFKWFNTVVQLYKLFFDFYLRCRKKYKQLYDMIV